MAIEQILSTIQFAKCSPLVLIPTIAIFGPTNDDETSQWMNDNSISLTYDEHNNLIEIKSQNWENSEWVNYHRFPNYIYEGCNELSIDENLIPHLYNINSIYPNPFNPTTTISFSIPEFGLTTITAYDITGRELETLTNEVLSIGNYSI